MKLQEKREIYMILIYLTSTKHVHKHIRATRPPDEKDTFSNDRQLTHHSHLKFQK